MNVTYESLVNSDIPFKTERTIENTLWVWDQIKTDFQMNEWFSLTLSPLKKYGIDDLLQAIRPLVNRVSGVIDPRASRKGWRTQFLACIEQPHDSTFGDHLHCLMKVSGGLTPDQEQLVRRKIKSMEIFRESSRAVRIRPICPQGTFLDLIKTLHYSCKQTTQHYDPYAYYK